ncbi:hypothetical protein C7M84_010286 [Penaeus vannamei]|uniref:Uncharacterized protein n=1 Tax=Penaeus vannamei TaxID=6689 RepID=A0A3R7QLP4_PENVA|nr:hypothetical protein C7M84_010286 [Penaeus vannamei]
MYPATPSARYKWEELPPAFSRKVLAARSTTQVPVRGNFFLKMTPPYLLVALAWVAAATIASGTPRTLEASFVGHVNSATSAFPEALATHSQPLATTRRENSLDFKDHKPRFPATPGSGEVKVVKRSAQFQARARYLPQNIVTVLETACVETTTVAVPLESLVFPMPCVCDLCSYTPSSEVCNCLRAPECRA